MQEEELDGLADARQRVVQEMARYGRKFAIEGNLVRGPGTTAVALREHREHVDLGFVLELGRGDAPVVWDCTAGADAVGMWAATTGAAVLELLEQQGRFGRTSRFGDWSAVEGPARVFGPGKAELERWLDGQWGQLVRAVAEFVEPLLDHPELNAVRFFFGGRAGDEVGEVWVNGESVPEASAALRALDWPRPERLTWARKTVLLAALPQKAAGLPRDTPVAGPLPRPRRLRWLRRSASS